MVSKHKWEYEFWVVRKLGVKLELVMAFIRKFKTGSGATGVQVCWKQGGEIVRTEHIGSANSDVALEKLLKKAQKIIDEGKRSLFDLNDFNRELPKEKK